MPNGSKVTTRSSKSENDTVTADNPTPSLQSIDNKLNSILGMLERNTNDILEIKNEQKDLCSSIELCHSNINDLKLLITNQGSKISNCEAELVHVNEENVRLKKEIKALENNISELEQYSHRNNLIVYGIPEDKNENIQHVMRRLATAVQFPDWSLSLVDAVHRMGKPSQSKSRPIIIRFVSRIDKEEFLRRRKVRRNLKAADLGFSSDNSIYVNESLTSSNRDLLKMTRETARARGYAQVWTANCAIFVRKNREAPAIRISSTATLDQL